MNTSSERAHVDGEIIDGGVRAIAAKSAAPCGRRGSRGEGLLEGDYGFVCDITLCIELQCCTVYYVER